MNQAIIDLLSGCLQVDRDALCIHPLHVVVKARSSASAGPIIKNDRLPFSQPRRFLLAEIGFARSSNIVAMVSLLPARSPRRGQ